MVRAFYPAVLRRKGPFPPLRAVWTGHEAGRDGLDELRRLTALPDAASLPILYPQVAGFPLQMAVLTDVAFPLPIWGALQIRNRMLQRRAIPVGASLHFETRVAGQRTLEKGVELDLATTVHEGRDLVWESVNTFLYRGRRFGPAGPPSPGAAAPEVEGGEVARWRTPTGTGWRFGRLTGDFNGVHWSDAYARFRGFRRAFHQPYAVVGHCLARLPAVADGAQGLDVWLKGPVYEGADVSLTAREAPGETAFFLFAGERRPAIVGRWRALPAGSRLMPDDGGSDARGEMRELRRLVSRVRSRAREAASVDAEP
jgi:hypothetical protein